MDVDKHKLMEEQNNNVKIVDIHKVWLAMKRNKKIYYKVLPIVFVLSCLWILPQPRFYVASVSLAQHMAVNDLPNRMTAYSNRFVRPAATAVLKLSITCCWFALGLNFSFRS